MWLHSLSIGHAHLGGLHGVKVKSDRGKPLETTAIRLFYSLTTDCAKSNSKCPTRCARTLPRRKAAVRDSSTSPDANTSCAHATAVNAGGARRTTSTRRGRDARGPVAKAAPQDATRREPGPAGRGAHTHRRPREAQLPALRGTLGGPPAAPRAGPREPGSRTPAERGDGAAAAEPPEEPQSPSPSPRGRRSEGTKGPPTPPGSLLGTPSPLGSRYRREWGRRPSLPAHPSRTAAARGGH